MLPLFSFLCLRFFRFQRFKGVGAKGPEKMVARNPPRVLKYRLHFCTYFFQRMVGRDSALLLTQVEIGCTRELHSGGLSCGVWRLVFPSSDGRYLPYLLRRWGGTADCTLFMPVARLNSCILRACKSRMGALVLNVYCCSGIEY